MILIVRRKKVTAAGVFEAIRCSLRGGQEVQEVEQLPELAIIGNSSTEQVKVLAFASDYSCHNRTKHPGYHSKRCQVRKVTADNLVED